MSVLAFVKLCYGSAAALYVGAAIGHAEAGAYTVAVFDLIAALAVLTMSTSVTLS